MTLKYIWRSFQPRMLFPRPFQQPLACFRVARSPSNSWASCLCVLAHLHMIDFALCCWRYTKMYSCCSSRLEGTARLVISINCDVYVQMSSNNSPLAWSCGCDCVVCLGQWTCVTGIAVDKRLLIACINPMFDCTFSFLRLQGFSLTTSSSNKMPWQ